MHRLKIYDKSRNHPRKRPHGAFSRTPMSQSLSMPAARPATELRIISRGEAASMIQDADFLKQWRRLHAMCPWASAFQSPDFVSAWYRCYAPDYVPLLIVSRTACGLDGLLPLAVTADETSVCHAGDTQAHCQAWICQMEDAMQFPMRAMRLLRQAVRLPLKLTNLPAGLPLDWLHHKEVRQTIFFHRSERPLLRFCAHTDLQAAMSDLNETAEGLKRFGPISLQRIEDRKHVEELIGDILLFHDLRQAAIHVTPPPRQQARRRAFNLLLAETGNALYATVLKVGNLTASAQLGLAHNRRLHLTTLAANPLLSSLSPEKLHLRMLAQQLYAQNFCQMDMPVDNDPQWSAMSNTREDARHIVVHPNRRQCLLHRADKALAATVEPLLKALPLSPQSIDQLADKLRRSSPLSIIKGRLLGLGRFIRNSTEVRMYRARLDDLPPATSDAAIFRDHLDHLMLYEPCEGWQSRCRFIRTSIARISHDTHVYTCAEQGKLLHFSWLIENPQTAMISEVQQEFSFPNESVYLFDAYTLPPARGKGLCSRAQRSMIHDIRQDGRFRYVYVSVRSNNYASRHIIEKMGYTYQGSLVQTITLGRARRWAKGDS